MSVCHNCLSLGMKNFRKVTIIILAVITVLFAGNIFFLHSLYSSVKEQYLVIARDCLSNADIIEIMKRLNDRYNYPDSNISVVLDINHRMSESGDIINSFERRESQDSKTDEKLLSLADAFKTTIAHNLRSKSAEFSGQTNFRMLDSLFLTEMNEAGLHPKHAFILPADSVPPSHAKGMWTFDYSLFKGQSPIYRAYISYPLSDLIYSTGGIITTTALIVAALAFAFFYLIHTVMKMRSLDEMKEDFINNMTHELKTPIAAAYSANDTLLNYGKHHDAEKRERYLRLAIEQLTRLSKLVENILSMSMERRKNFTLAREKTAVKPLLSEIADIQTLKANKPVEIDVDVVPENLEIECDPVHFGNVINNLLDNAIKYSGETVRIKMRADSGSISVSDNGIGISHKALPLIFNKFYRVPTGKRQDVRGYGIGLYYVHSIVEKHGWKISAASSPGKGTVFTIRLKDDEK